MEMNFDKLMEIAKAMQEEEGLSPEQRERLKKLEQDTEGLTQKTVETQEENRAEIAGGRFSETEEIAGKEKNAFPMPLAEPEPAKEEDFIIRFDAPYRFEGKTYTGIDLSGLRELRAKDIWKLNRAYRNSGNIPLLQEMDNEYTARVAARAAGLPIEFFEGMPLPESIKVRAMVSGFFYPKD